MREANELQTRALRVRAFDDVPGFFLAYLAVMLLAVTAYLTVVDSPLGKGSLIVAIALSSALAVLVGIERNRPARRDLWYLVAAALAVGAVGAGIWYTKLVVHGAPPTPGGVQDIFFIAFYFLLGAPLVVALKRSEVGNSGVIDAGIFAAGGTLLAFLVLIDPHVATTDLPALGRGVQITSAIADVCLLGIAIRLVLTPDSRTPALRLLVAATFAWLASDFIWIWLTLVGDYVPGSSGDIGWLLFYVLCGAAALHPSMGAVSAERKPREPTVDSRYLVFLAAALLAGPAVAAYGVFSNAETNSTGRIAVTFVLSLLVFTRLASLLAGERRLREELVRRNERLLELDRMKDDFVAAVSHELRTPLTSTLGFLRTLEARDSELGEAERRRFVTIARSEGERLELLVQDLLSVAENNALRLDRSVVDLSKLARARVQCARATAEKKQIDLTFVAEGAPAIRADDARLAQVLDNLLSNALKFTPAGGRVDVRVSSAPGRAVLEVEDTGIGIPAREREHVFERFFRASTTAARAIPGTGLGLAIVKAIVDAHGGTLAVTNTEATGSLFRIEFPLLVRGREAGERESLARAEH